MEYFKQLWHKVPHPLRKVSVFVVGWTVVLSGIAMLALPGPGWAAIFLGFAILATEYTSARQVRDWMVNFLKKILFSLKGIINHLTKRRKNH